MTAAYLNPAAGCIMVRSGPAPMMYCPVISSFPNASCALVVNGAAPSNTTNGLGEAKGFADMVWTPINPRTPIAGTITLVSVGRYRAPAHAHPPENPGPPPA